MLALFPPRMKTQKFDDEIQQDLVDGLSAGIAATPTFYINGLKVEGAVTLEVWEKIITDFFAAAAQ